MRRTSPRESAEREWVLSAWEQEQEQEPEPEPEPEPEQEQAP